MAGVFPRSAERSRLFLAAEPAAPPGEAELGPAAELQQQQAEHAEEPPAGAAAGAPQGSGQMSRSLTARLPSPVNTFTLYVPRFNFITFLDSERFGKNKKARCHRLEFALAAAQIRLQFLSNMFGPAAPFDAFLYLKPCRIFI